MLLTMVERQKISTLNCLKCLKQHFLAFIVLKKQPVLKKCVKNHLKIFLILLCRILHTCRERLSLLLHLNLFSFITSNVAYFKKHIACQVQHPQETKFPLLLNLFLIATRQLSLQQFLFRHLKLMKSLNRLITEYIPHVRTIIS